MDTCQLLATRLRMKRAELDISQIELAQMCGLSADSIQKYENSVNNPTISSLMKLSIALHTDPNYLLGWDEKEK